LSEGTSVPEDRRYTEEHEWALVDDGVVVVGITDFAQHELGDIVYVELPRLAARVAQGTEFGVVESVKSASDLYSPVSGEVVALNSELAERPELVNESPYDAGWMMRVRPDDLAELESLLDAARYRQLIEG
jgi:glycine cleavage system H protein